ncbi:septum formation initiator family protein [Halorhodospira neutriphila]|uniref:Cell division protein FtsB n=1 Tax=Halorhodospira neutriphila TaxID=168379 RepID=A0ABS1E9I2_9GAMM|nr:septation ring formation regulator EzrA [Halorhodospira neutriphila]
MRWISIGLGAALLALQWQLWIGASGVPELLELRASIAEQRAANRRAEQRNDALAAKVESLKEGPEALEGRARRELGMIREDEVFYQVVEE